MNVFIEWRFVTRTVFAIALAVSAEGSPANVAALTLKDSLHGRFEIGVGISDRIPERSQDWPLLKAQFSMVTPENCMKPDPVQVRKENSTSARPTHL